MILNNQFIVRKQIGKGSYSKFFFLIFSGEVFEAYDTNLGVNVALKMEKEDISKVFLKHEYLMLYHLQNFNLSSNTTTKQRVPKIYNFFSNSNRNFYTLELLEISLLNYLNDKDCIVHRNIYSKLYVINEILAVIEEIHFKGYIHLDLKPSNIMVNSSKSTKDTSKTIFDLNFTNTNEPPSITLIDFGLTRPYNSDYFDKGIVGKEREFVGTLKYASLNAHTREAPLGRIDDLWSFFFILIEILNIKIPWNIEINKNEKSKSEIIVSFIH